MRSNDLLSGLGLLLVAAGFYWAATGLQVSTLSDDFGPQGFPKVLAACLGAVSIGLIGRALLARVAAPASPPPPPEAAGDEPGEATLPRALGLLAIGAGYVAIVRVVGYVPAIALLIAAVALYEGLRPSPRLAAVALGGAAFFWLLFVQLLGVPQPRGLFF